MDWLPDYLKNLATANYGMWNSPTPGLTLDGHVQPGEGGVDIGTPNGTPVYAIASGPIQAAGYWNDSAHGVITQRVNVPGQGPQDLYYQHIQLDPSISQCQGNCQQYVTQGQRIGTIGPLNEIEMGFNSEWGGVWGTNHPGPWIRDPRPWLNAILGGTSAAPPTSTDSSSGSSSTSGGTDWVAQLHNEGIKIGVFVLALVLTGFGFYILFQKQADGLIKKGVEVAAL